jgi:hypothetical protein
VEEGVSGLYQIRRDRRNASGIPTSPSLVPAAAAS